MRAGEVRLAVAALAVVGGGEVEARVDDDRRRRMRQQMHELGRRDQGREGAAHTVLGGSAMVESEVAPLWLRSRVAAIPATTISSMPEMASGVTWSPKSSTP